MQTQDVQESQPKVTVGFKCDPGLKNKLSKDAQKLDISLSEYTEGIISNYYNPEKPSDKQEIKTDKSAINPDQDLKTCFNNFETKLSGLLAEEVLPIMVSMDELKELLTGRGTGTDIDERISSLTEQNENLTKELAEITANEGLQQLFEKYKGKTLEYKNQDGEVRKIKVTGYADIITALVETIIDKQ